MSVSHSDAAALLVLDLQVDFVEHDGRMPIAPDQIDQVLRTSNNAIEAAAAHHTVIAYIGNEYTRWDIPGNWFRHNAALGGTPGAALDPRVKRLSAAPYFPKRQGDAFSNPDLARFLRSHHIHRVVICGVYADACVTATARGALRRGLAVTVLADAVGAASDAARQSALAKIGRAGAQIETTGEFINHLEVTSHAANWSDVSRANRSLCQKKPTARSHSSAGC
ncbi:MAG: cysteine hydrolase family protein [Candidatus Binataceae bacterium]